MKLLALLFLFSSFLVSAQPLDLTRPITFDLRDVTNSCEGCPEHLSLVSSVNNILGKLEQTAGPVINHNHFTIELNRLRFLYAETKSLQDGALCEQLNPSKQSEFEDGKLKLIAEEMMSLPNVNGVQIYPGNESDRKHFFYRGEGEYRNYIVEVITALDKTVMMRLHKFEPTVRPVTVQERRSEERSRPIPLITTPVKVDGQVMVGDGLTVSTTSKSTLVEQRAKMSLSGEREWLVVSAEHNTGKNINVQTVIPVEISVDDSSGLKVDGSLEYERNENYRSGAGEVTRRASLALTDHNHEYLRTALVAEGSRGNALTLSSRYNFGSYGTVEGIAERDFSGGRSYRLSHSAGNERDRFRTALGMDASRNRFIEFQNERRLSQTSSVVLTIRQTQGGDKHVMYQYRGDFR